MKERPILFSGSMVRAILEGHKTHTRRVVKPRLIPIVEECFRVNGKWCNHTFDYDLVELCPYGVPGDRLWVKETFSAHGAFGADGRKVYRSDIADAKEPHGLNWKPSIFMPRRASRITLSVMAVRAERLNEITRGYCMAEGCPFPNMAGETDPVGWYSDLWESINGPGSWKLNPWVWVVEFKREVAS